MSQLKLKKRDQTLVIHLSDPESHNAFSPAMAEELGGILDRERFSAMVLSHEGESFCSGGNLRYYKNLPDKKSGIETNQRISQILKRLAELPIPKACFVDGTCYGGGVELISCFDHIVASPSALFGLWQRRVGLTFGWGGQSRLLERMSNQTLNAWLLQARTISAYRAKKWGLVDEIQLSSTGLETCMDWVNRSLAYGEENLGHILSDRSNQAAVFSELWMGERHKQILKKF